MEPVQAREQGLSGLRVVVVDANNQAVKGAVVSWTPYQTSTSSGTAQGLLGVEELIEASAWAVADGEGVAEVDPDQPLEEERVGVIWASHPDYLAAYHVSAPVGDLRIVLAESPPLSATVEDGQGQKVRGAYILQRGQSVDSLRRLNTGGVILPAEGVEAQSYDQAMAHFARRYELDEDGSASLSRAGAPSLIVAVAGERRSVPAPTGLEQEHLRLVLHDGVFAAGGHVTMASGGQVPGGVRVIYSWSGGNSPQRIGAAVVDADGSWGPVDLPAVTTGDLLFFPTGGGVYSSPTRILCPVPSSPLEIDFIAELGVVQRVHVTDEDGVGIAQAKVQILWPDGDAWPHGVAWTDGKGIADVTGCKPTTVWVRAIADGFLQTTSGATTVPREEPFEVVMPRAGVLAGHVSFEGEPVEAFTVLVWEGSPRSAVYHSFSNRKDGSFRIDEARIGQAHVMAISAIHAESDAQLVQVSPGAVASVELTLNAGVAGHGQVIDSVTGEPLVQASVQALAAYSDVPLATRGASVSVDASGSFKLDYLGASEAFVRVMCEGYVTGTARGWQDPGGGMSFGVVPLSKPQALTIRLEGAPPFATDGWWLGGDGPRNIPYVAIPKDGVLTIEDVAPGLYSLVIVDVEGVTLRRRALLSPGEEWEVLFPFGSGQAIEVHCLAGDDVEFSDSTALLVNFLDEQGRGANIAHALPPDGVVHISNVPSREVELVLFDSNITGSLARKRVTLDGPGPHVVELEAVLPGLTVQAVGLGDADPLGCTSSLSFQGETGRDPIWRDLNEHGQAFFQMPPAGAEVVVVMTHPELGFKFCSALIGTHDEQVIEVELSGGFDVEYQVRDGDEPVPGAWVSLRPATAGLHVLNKLTDQAGSTSWKKLQGGMYSVTLERDGYWQASHEREVIGGGAIPLTIRRRGNLRLSLRSTSGPAISGATFTLYSTEFNTTVSEWRAQKRLAADAVQLTTDAQGKAQVVGIPHGEYQWSVRLGDGSLRSGVTVVPAGEWGALEVLVGD